MSLSFKRTMLTALTIVILLGSASQLLAQAEEKFDPNREYDLEIVTWTADKETEGAAWTWLINEYQRVHPNVRIRHIVQSNRTYKAWATAQFKNADSTPDIMQSFPWDAWRWGAEQGYLVPIRSYLNQPSPYDKRYGEGSSWIQGLYQELLEQNADPYYGEIWTIPISLNTQRFFYNKDIFDRYGLEVPRTYSELGEVCRRIRQESAGTIAPIAMWQAGAWLDHLGAAKNRHLIPQYDLVRKDWIVDSNEQLIGALQGKWNARTEEMYAFHKMMKKMNDEGWFQDGWTGFDTNQCDNLFINGNAAIIREGYWMKEGFDKRIAGRFEFAVMAEPLIDAGFAGLDLGKSLELMNSSGSELAITRRCQERGRMGAAIDFLQWMTSPEVARNLGIKRGAMPSTSGLEEVVAPEIQVFAPEIGGQPAGPIFFTTSVQMRTAMQQMAPLYVSGEMELDELKDKMERLHDRFIDLQLQDVKNSTRAGIFKGARLYVDFMYKQEDLRRQIEQGRAEGRPVENLESRRQALLQTFATTMDKVAENEVFVQTLIPAAWPEQGVAAYRHIPLIDDKTEQALRTLGAMLVMASLVVLVIVLLRKNRIRRIFGFQEKSIYLFLAPTLLMIFIFSYYPAFSAIYHAFTRWDGVAVDEFIGLSNLKELFSDQILAVSIVNLLWMLAAFFVKIVPPLICAVVLYHVASERLRYYFRVMFVLPLIVPGIVYWMVWKLLYQPAPSGIFNQLLLPVQNFLQSIGFDVTLTYNWLADPRTALGAVIFLGFPWVGTLGVLIYLAGLENIDPNLFEAADIDGAGFLRKFWYIELPLLMRQIRLNLVLGLISVIQGFGIVLFLTRGGPAFSTTVPGYQMYSEAFDMNRMGYASAIGLVMFIVIVGATLLTNRTVRPQD